MLQRLSDRIAECLRLAAAAEARAFETSDDALKADNLRMAKAWERLASSYQFVESLERFLIDAEHTRNQQASTFVLRLASPDYNFEPETLALMCACYDRAIATLGGIRSNAVRQTVAKNLIEAAARGRRDPDELCRAALSET